MLSARGPSSTWGKLYPDAFQPCRDGPWEPRMPRGRWIQACRSASTVIVSAYDEKIFRRAYKILQWREAHETTAPQIAMSDNAIKGDRS